MNRKETLWGFVFLFAQLLLIPLAILLVIELAGLKLSYSMENFLCFAANFLCAAIIFHRFWLASLKDIAGKGFEMIRTALIYFALYFAASALVNILIYNLDPGFSNANDEAIATIMYDNKLLISATVVLLVPPVEEVLYRGLIFGKLYNRSPLLGYLVSITAFAAIHVLSYIGSVPPARLLLCFLQYVPAGFCLARAYAVTGNLFTPILIHAMINMIASFSM